MNFEPYAVYHVYNRGNQRQVIFFEDDHYLLFLRKIRDRLSPYCDILTWCLMPNYFHFIISPKDTGCVKRVSGLNEVQRLSYNIGIVLSSYTSIINKERGLTGSLFQKKTKAKRLERVEDVIRCMHYIHQNPLAAGLITDAIEAWKYSSFQDYFGFRNGTLCNSAMMFDLTGYDKGQFLSDSYANIDIESIKRFY